MGKIISVFAFLVLVYELVVYRWPCDVVFIVNRPPDMPPMKNLTWGDACLLVLFMFAIVYPWVKDNLEDKRFRCD